MKQYKHKQVITHDTKGNKKAILELINKANKVKPINAEQDLSPLKQDLSNKKKKFWTKKERQENKRKEVKNV